MSQTMTWESNNHLVLGSLLLSHIDSCIQTNLYKHIAKPTINKQLVLAFKSHFPWSMDPNIVFIL